MSIMPSVKRVFLWVARVPVLAWWALRALGRIVWCGKPCSRAVLWMFLPFALLTITAFALPQAWEILTQEWTADGPHPWIGIPAILIAAAEWGVFLCCLVRLDWLLQQCNRGRRLRAARRLARRNHHAVAAWFAGELECVPAPYRAWKGIGLGGAVLGFIAVAVSLFVLYLFPNDSACVFLLLQLCIHSGVACAFTHLGVSHRTQLFGVLPFLPFLLIFLGLFAVDAWAVVATMAVLSALILLPVVLLLWGSGENPKPILWGKRALLFAAIVLLVSMRLRWNWYDQRRYPHEDPDEQASGSGLLTHPTWTEAKPGTDGWSLPPVFLNLGGGGSRAAIFAALTVDELWWLPMDDPLEESTAAYLRSGCPPYVRKLIEPGDGHFYPGRLLLLGVRTISSVSGGSLASAYWTAGTLEADRAHPPDAHAGSYERRAHALRSFFGEADRSRVAAAVQRERPRERQLQEPELTAVDGDSFVQAMSRNYLAEAIFGLFSPSSSRSQTIRASFGESLGPSHSLASLFEAEKAGVLPYSVFNATITSSGERFAITNLGGDCFQPLPEMFGPLAKAAGPTATAEPGHRMPSPKMLDAIAKATAGLRLGAKVEEAAGSAAVSEPLDVNSLRFRASPGAVTVQSRLAPKWNPSLATAVWVSSDFPIGFPVSRIRSDVDRHIKGTLDGGILDNRGVNTTFALLRGRAAAQLPAKAASSSRRSAPAEPIQPFFLFDIDTSEMAFDPSPSLGLWYHLREYFTTANRVEQVHDLELNSQYLSELQRTFGPGQADPVPIWLSDLSTTGGGAQDDRIPAGVERDYVVGFHSAGESRDWPSASKTPWGWYRVRSGELRPEHVSTSWHLPRRERWKLIQMALNTNMRHELRQASRQYLALAAYVSFQRKARKQ